LTFLFSSSEDINNYAHIGGVICGAILGLFLPPLASIGGKDLGLAERILLWGAIGFSAVAIVFALLNLAATVMHGVPLFQP
jgi:hypothetical protein